jgi:hypothetical protein
MMYLGQGGRNELTEQGSQPLSGVPSSCEEGVAKRREPILVRCEWRMSWDTISAGTVHRYQAVILFAIEEPI